MIEKRSTRDRRRCFFDISIDGESAGRIVMELFDELAPRTCENFVMLCTGQAGTGKLTGKPLHYKGSLFHRLVKGFMIQGGDFSAANGTGGESIYGGVFEDEDFVMKHNEPFMLSMANRGKDSNGSQFFITTAAASHLDGVHVVFGKVISGKELVTRIENLKVNAKNKPISDVLINGCGQLVKKKKDVSSDSSEDRSIEDDRHKKKKHKKEKRRNRSSEGDNHRRETSKAAVETDLPENISSVKKEDLPEEPGGQNKFLHRRSSTPERHRDRRDQQTTIRTSRTGHKVKGRGAIRFRADDNDRSRSVTPPHWKREEERLITLSELEKIKKQKKEREEKEAKRRSETTEIDTFGYKRRPGFELPPVQDHHRGHRPVLGDSRDYREDRSRSRDRSRERHRSSRKSDENVKNGHHSKKQEPQPADEEEEEDELEDVGPIIDMDYLLAKAAEKEHPPKPVPEPIPVDPMPPVKDTKEDPSKRKDSLKEVAAIKDYRDTRHSSYAFRSSHERSDKIKEAEPKGRPKSRSRSPVLPRNYQQRSGEQERERRDERGNRNRSPVVARRSSRERNERAKEVESSRGPRSRSRSLTVPKSYNQRSGEQHRDRREVRETRERRTEGGSIRHQERNPPPLVAAKAPIKKALSPVQSFKSTKINLDEVLEKANAHVEAHSLAALNKQREINQRKLMEESRSILSKPVKELEEDRSSKRKRQSLPLVEARNEPKRHRSRSKSPIDAPMRDKRSKSPDRDKRSRRSPSPRHSKDNNQVENAATVARPPSSILPPLTGVSALLLKSNSPPKRKESSQPKEKAGSLAGKKERSKTPEKVREKVASTTTNENRSRRRSISVEKSTVGKDEVQEDLKKETKKEKSKSPTSKSSTKKSSPAKRGKKSRSVSSASKSTKNSMSPPAHFRDDSSSSGSSASSRCHSKSSDNSARRHSSRSMSRGRRRNSSSSSSSSSSSASSSSSSSRSSSAHSRRGRRSRSRSRSNRRYSRRSRSRSNRRRRRSSSGRRSRSRSYRRGRHSRSRSRRR